MPVHHGKNGKVKLGAANVVAEVTGFSVTETVAVSDTTAMGDTAQTHLTGIPGWTASIDGNYDPADANGQNALVIGASVTVGLYTEGDGAGKKYLTGTASVTNIGRTASVSERVSFSVALTGNGALTQAAVA